MRTRNSSKAGIYLLCGLIILLSASGCTAVRDEWGRGLAARAERARLEAIREAQRTAAAAPRPKPAFWHPEAGSGAPRIVINLGEQRAYFYKGETIIGESNISSGKKGFETPPGRYRVTQKDANHFSSQYGRYVNAAGEVVARDVDRTRDPQPEGTEYRGVPMPYFLRFTRGYGMHAGFVPRFRASHGCVRMPTEMAQNFFNEAKVGTPVIVEE